jgi:copper homeostasis protein (lipoprotein)
LLLASLVIPGLGSCLSNRGLNDTHNSRNSLDWEGVYTGTIPSASGSGIDVRLKLNTDQSFELGYEYIGRSDSTFNRTGSFQWDKKESIIILKIDDDVPPYYKVAENMLIQLDMKGKTISGNMAENYVLKKEL